MNHHQAHKTWLLAGIAALLLAALAATPLASRASPELLTPAQIVQQAWQRARDLGVYRFTTDLAANVYPVQSLASVGQPGRKEQLHMEGSVDLPSRTLLFSLWQGAGSVLNPSDSVEIRIEGDQAYGRQAGGRWEAINDFSGSFAPGGDLLVYLVGAKNVVDLGTKTIDLPIPRAQITQPGDSSSAPVPALSATYSRYGFDLDGPAMAEEVRQQWQRELQEKGELPAGAQLQAPAEMRLSTGHGELWLDSQGLPARLVVEIAYPPEKENGGGRATIKTSFSGFPTQLAQDSTGLLAGTLDAIRPASQDFRRAATQVGLVLAVGAFALLLVFHGRSRRVYIGLVLTIILSMVIAPLAEGQQAAAFSRKQAERQANYETRQKEARQQQEYQEDMHTSTWDPHQDPLAASEPATLPVPPAAAQESSLPALGQPAPYQVTQLPAVTETLDPLGDDDLDTLTNIEEQNLGTDPDLPDTDGDQLRDDLEVRGFPLGGTTWTSDPLSVDSNSDGRPDLQECWTEFPLDLPSNVPCNLDTNQDGEPDLFDDDNDGDGVVDEVDISPLTSMATFDGYNPFLLKLNNLDDDYLTFVDLQLRPTNPDHLTYTFWVGDWPTGDTKGQIQRVLDTTFADSMTEEEIQKDPRSANGDMRLIPLIEITIPYMAGHTRNLPVKPGWNGTLGTTTPEMEEWVDMALLAQYGLTVRYADDTGAVVIYAPLSLVSDEVGGASVAYATRLPYKVMASGNWGNEHQVRFIWAIQMITDHCKDVPDSVEDAVSWCAEAANRQEETQIVHIYDESWVLAGLDVREDHGLQMGIAFEDPAHDANLNNDRNLWALAFDLDQAWLSAMDCELVDVTGECVGNGVRDLTVPEIVHRFDNTSNGDIPEDDPRLWNIPKNALKVWHQDFAYQDLMVSVPITYTKEILNQYFLQNGQSIAEAPTLLFLREEHYRSANMDSRAEVASRVGSNLTINLDTELVSIDTMAALNWSPYRYRDGAWEPYPLEEYGEILDLRLETSFPPDPNDPDGYYVSQGQVIIARGFYLSLVQGVQEIVQSGDLIYHKPDPGTDVKLRAESIKVSGNIVLTIVKLAGEQIAGTTYYLVRLVGGLTVKKVEDLFEWIGKFNKPGSEKGLGGLIGWNKETGKWLSMANRISIATLIIFTICATVLAILSVAIDAKCIPYIQSGLALVANTIRFMASAVKFFGEFARTFAKASFEWINAMKSLWSQVKVPWTASVKGAFILTIVIEALIAIGVFVYTWASSHIRAGSLAWDKMLVDMIARIVVKSLLWALNFIPVIGKVLYLLITAIDALVSFICSFLSDKARETKTADWLCGGISGILSHIFSYIFYGQHLIVDIEDEERWQIGVPEISLEFPNSGFSVGNALSYQLTLTNTLHLAKFSRDWKSLFYRGQYSADNLKRSAFAYGISGSEGIEHYPDLHSNLALDQITSEWELGPVRDDKQTYQIVRQVDTTTPAMFVAAGINLTTTVYLDEGYAVPVQECIAFPYFLVGLFPYCWVRETKGSWSADMGNSFPWDVFPSSLDGFFMETVIFGGFGPAWAQGGEVKFARQKDFDGDSLLNTTDGGPDPNDSQWDADHDGLSDYFELEIGLKPDEVYGYDPDFDGLNDREELLSGSDPFKVDTDGDGLSDYQEWVGWDAAYGFDAAGSPLLIRVTSNPLMTDTDFDTLTDFQEYNYRYNPRAVSDPNVLGFSSQLSERTPGGAYEPSDGLVRPGDQLRYEATVENKTLLASAQGLHAARLPEDRLSGSTAPHTFLLNPQEKETLSADLSVKPGIPSGPANLTQTAGARITYALADSDYAQTLLHLEDLSTATTFADSSGNIPPHNGQCSGAQCPTRQVAGYIGSAVQFDAAAQQTITVPDVDISTGAFGVAFWFKTSQATTGLFSSADGSMNLSLSGGNLCWDLKVQQRSAPFCYTSAINYADNKWHHYAFSYGSILYMYADGKRLWGSGGYTRVNPSPQSGVRFGYATSPSSYFSGLLDEAVVYDRELTEQEVGAMTGMTPLLAMHLDEPAGAMTFAEDHGLNASCNILQMATCPAAGVVGAVSNSAGFSGNQNLSLPTLPHLAGTFTIAVWIFPTGTSTSAQGIVGHLDTNIAFSYPTLVRAGTGVNAYFGGDWPLPERFVQMGLVPDVLTLNTWNQVVLTYGFTPEDKGQFDLYVNGVHKSHHVLDWNPWPASNRTGEAFNIGNVWAGETYNPAYPASPFTGQIDEVLVYPFTLTEVQVDELYRNQSEALHLPFDEPPGAYQFQDARRRAAGSCPNDLATCPTAGVTGRAGQAADFDGANDALDVGMIPAISGKSPFSLSAWVRTTAAKDQVIVNQRSAAVYNGEYMLGLTAQGKVYWFTWGNSGAATFNLTSNRTVNDGKWHHVLAVRDANGSAFVYVDGTLDASLLNSDPNKIASLVATNVYVGADIRDHAQYFDGTIDELQLIRRALTAAEILSLAHAAPRFLLHLEEPAGAGNFAVDTELTHEAYCASMHCPNTGVKGQINLAADFDGVNDGIITNYATPSVTDKTIMAWVRPGSTSPGRHMVLAVTDDWSWSLYRDGAAWYVGTGSLTPELREWNTGMAVQASQWQHLAVVYHGNAVRFFVNGHAMGDLSIGEHTNAGQLSVGTERYTWGGSPWDGKIDEVAVYERALTDIEIETLWRYQGQWVQEMHTTPILVDNDNPHSGLASGSPYRANQPVNLLIQTSDATSAVTGAQWQVDSGAWQNASPCDAGQGATWCPTFDPALFHGPGVYTIHTRATDAVGNVSSTSSAQLYVDDQAPAVSINLAAGALVPLQPGSSDPGTWILPVSGAAQDPVVASAVPGSGVQNLKVTLEDAYGHPAGSGASLSPDQNGIWDTAITISGPILPGAYMVRVEASDQVGNLAVTGTRIYLDPSPPQASLVGLPPGGARLVLHLDEAAGATQFADSSGYSHYAVCGKACPTSGVAGKFGKAVQLSGATQSLAVWDVKSVSPSDFTLAAWFQSSSPAWQTILAASTVSYPYQGVLLLRLTSEGKVRFTYAPAGETAVTDLTSPHAFNNGQWHHAAAVRSGDDLLLYVDGEIVAAGADSRPVLGELRVTIGEHLNTQYFNGLLDEVVLLPLALGGAAIAGLSAAANPPTSTPLTGVVSEAPQFEGAVLELNLEEPAGAAFADSSAWGNVATCSGMTCPGRAASGTLFGQALRFDGSDDRLAVRNWGALTSVTAAAWVQRTSATTTRETILSHKEQASCGFVLSLNEIAGGHYPRFWVRVGSAWLFAEQAVSVPRDEWVHLAGTYDGQKIRLFRDGVQVAETEAPGAMQDDCEADTAIGSRSSQNMHFFPGLIDEVKLFDRALARDEMQALATRKYAGVSALDLAASWEMPGSPFYNAPMPQGAQFYYPFDETPGASLTFTDISGQARSGKCSGLACPSAGFGGHAGGAYRFDGVDDYLEVPLNVSEDVYALALWFKTSCSNCGIFSVDAGTLGAGGYDRTLYLSQGHVCARLFSNETVCTKGAYADGRWHHVVHTFGGAEGGQKIYLDGAFEYGGAKTSSNFTWQDGINIGFSNDAGLDYFNGLLDEVILFNRALSAAEANALYLGTDTVLRLSLDESWAAGGSQLADSSIFARPAALEGAASNHAVPGAVGAGALELDGAGDYVTTGQSINFAPGDYTVSGWFRTSAAVQQVLLSATNPADDASGIQLYLDPAGQAHFLHRAPAGSSGGTDLASTGSALNDGAAGTWHHLAGVKAGTELALYVDGVLAATGAAGSGFGHALDVTLGRQGKTTAEAYWNGALDEVRIYARALSAGEVEEIANTERWHYQAISASGQGVARSDYSTSLNALKLEGFYRVDLQSMDVFGNRSDTTRGNGLWGGLLDNLPPRLSLQYQLTTVGSASLVHYQYAARDFNLAEASLVSPCPGGAPPTREYFNAPWFRAWTSETDPSTDLLYGLSGQCDVAYTGALASLTACDAAGNCATAVAEPLAMTVEAAGTVPALGAPAPGAPLAKARPSDGGGVLILAPAPGTFITNTLPLQVAGGAYSPQFLKTLIIRADRRVIDIHHWARPTVADTNWTATWTPRGEGPHLIEATLRDWANSVYTASVTVVLDSTPPEVAITTQVITSTHLASGQVSVSGTASDASGIARVDVLARGVWRPAVVGDGAWTATWTPELSLMPDGQILGGEARAVDLAGWATTVPGEVYVDIVGPSPVGLAFSYQIDGATTPITQTGATLREPGGALQMAWTPSSDGSGLQGYRAGWTASDAGGATTAWTDIEPDGTRLATITPAEGQKLVASLGARDNYGNTTWQDFGPLYADSPLTPDYTAINEPDGNYHGWMESGCTLLGTDRRLSRVAPALAQRRGEQSLYATWDAQALRLAWSGANWSADGDLFVYLDTAPGGSQAVFDPFTPPGARSESTSSPAVTLVTLPGSTPPGSAPSAATGEAMLADYAVWVHDAQTASLLAWDGSAWITATLLSPAQYQYQPSSEGGLTDLYLPFDLLGVSDPAASSLGLLAFATEEEALRLWAVLPRANPVTSLLATGSFGHLLEGIAGLQSLAVPMTHFYQWPSLGPGLCPNGMLALEEGQTPYPDAEVQARLTAEPAGTVYHYLGDHLYNWSEYLLGDKPLDFSGLLSFLDYDHPYVQDGQVLSYTLRLQNNGQDATHGVVARIWSTAALTLPGGTPVEGDEHMYYQEIAIGDLAPGAEQAVLFNGLVDLDFARLRYEQCLAMHPDRPLLCKLALRIAPLKVEVVDETSPAPLERIWADHRVDSEAPRFAGISQGGMFIASGSVHLGGYAYDDSGVPQLSLDILRPDGSMVSLPCPNADPASGSWSCDWDPTAANGGVPPEDGQVFQVRLQATDGAGQTGEPGPWQPFIIDTQPPTVTVQLPAQAVAGQPVAGHALRLDGQVTDNRGAAGVQVCLEGDCQPASTTLQGGLGLQRYTDQPEAPIALGACGAAEIQRTFQVAENFDLRAAGLGLRAEHPDSGQIRATLVSPSGTRVQVLSGERDLGSGYQNFAVLLADAASAAVSRLGGGMNLSLPGFLQIARPDEPLSTFSGEQAAGAWSLILCETGSGDEAGAYLGARLFLQPQNTAALSGAWLHSLALPEGDGIEQTVLVYGLDEAGNRSSQPWSRTFVVDNVPPALAVTGFLSAVEMTPDLAPMEVLAGTASDGGGVRKLFAQVRTPQGQVHIQPVTQDSAGWSFALQTMSPGSHAIAVVAEDAAGNQTAVGPFTVEVAAIPQPDCLAANPGVTALTAEPAPTDPFSLTVTAAIQNTGFEALPAGLPVSFSVDEEPLGTIITGQELAPGDSLPASILWAVAGPGDYAIGAVLNNPETFPLCQPPIPAYLDVAVRDLPLAEGGNLFSPPISPSNPEIGVVQRPVAGRYRQVVGFDGQWRTYDPAGPPEANTLSRIEAGFGYWINVLPGGSPPTATLRMAGSPVPVDLPLPLAEGWNLRGYLPAQTLAITDALASLQETYSGVLGFAGTGQSYYPDLDPVYNTLAAMAPGGGYWIRATQAVTLTYPTLVLTPTVPADLSARLEQIRLAEQAAGVHPTYRWMNFYGQTALPAGTVVLAVDPQGAVCGATVVVSEGFFGLLACYGDDPSTPQDEGGLPGDAIALLLSPGGQQIGGGTWTAHGERQEVAP